MTWPTKIIRFCIYLLFILVPLIFLPWTSELFEFNKIIVVYGVSLLISCFWIIQTILDRKFTFRRTPLDLPLILFLVFQLASLVVSQDLRTSLLGYYGRFNGGFISLLSYCLLYWTFVTFMDKKSSVKTISLSIFTAFLISFYGILQHFGIDSSYWVQDVKNRVFSTLGQPNWLASYLVALIFLPLSHCLSNSKRKIPHLLIFSLFFLCLLFTKSRSGLLSFGISSMVYFWLTFKFEKNFGTLKRHLLSIAAVIAILSIIFPNPARDLFIQDSTPALTPSSSPALESGGTESGAIRAIVWKGAISIWKSSIKNMLLGTGPETFASAYYQYRPIEHNNTSEWEFLYNKAHNEFLNYLSTTGALGLGSYLFLLVTIAVALFNLSSTKDQKDKGVFIALFSGWLSIPLTNFWGFSVVATQVLLFLLPAISLSLERESVRVDEHKLKKHSLLQKIALTLTCSFTLLLFYSLGRYWMADFHYAVSQKSMYVFSATEEAENVVKAYNSASTAYSFSPNEPVLGLQLAETAAYMSILTSDTATTSAELVDLSLSASQHALTISPNHPSFYKTRSRILILLSAIDDKYLDQADAELAKAAQLSPTDPRIPYNRAIIAKYNDQPKMALEYLKSALKLKPDFVDAKAQFEKIASESSR